MKKFNVKEYQNKQRVYQSVSGYSGVSKLWIWNSFSNEYEPPIQGNQFYARRKVGSFGSIIRQTKSFSSLSEARKWQIQLDTQKEAIIGGKTFGEVLSKWNSITVPSLKQSTQVSYKKIAAKYFSPLLLVRMQDFDSKVVDDWIQFLLNGERTHRRVTFSHELELLSAVLRFHDEYTDGFVWPIKRRHRKAIRVKGDICREKDITVDELNKFVAELRKLKNGSLYAALATTQFYQALRISEAAAIHWEDVKIDSTDMSESRLIIGRSVQWLRLKGAKPTLQRGYKNSQSNFGVKDQPLFRKTCDELLKFRDSQSSNGPIFCLASELLTYRQIQNAYDFAFSAAGLPYTGTHVLRHGGVRNIFNETGDIGLVQQMLGNKDIRSVSTYAVRATRALSDFAKKSWKRTDLAANGCIDSVNRGEQNEI